MKTEGTLVLDGLVEGTLPAGAEGRVRAWVDTLRGQGLEFHLELDGDSFSLLPSSQPLAAARLGTRPAEAVREALDGLLKTFPPAERAGVFSTLRSAEVKPGLEVQTVYVVNPEGGVEARERTVDAETRPAAPGVALRARVQVAGLVVLGLAALLGVASLFFDLKGALRGLWSRVQAVSASEVEVDVADFAPWLRVVKKADGPDGSTVLVTLERTPAYPADDAALDAALSAPDGDVSPSQRLRRRMALVAVARGRIHAELFAADGKALGGGEVGIYALRRETKVELEIRVTRDPRTVRIVLGP